MKTTPADAVAALTFRECEVLAAIAVGEPTTTTARRLCLSPSTITSHRKALLRKLDARSAAHAVAIAHAQGLLPAGPSCQYSDGGRLCAAEVVDQLGPILLCEAHLGRALELAGTRPRTMQALPPEPVTRTAHLRQKTATYRP